MNRAYWIVAQTGRTPYAVGDPGIGKTAQVYAFASAVGRDCCVLIGSIRDPADIGGYPYPHEGTMRLLPPDWAEIATARPIVVFIDELTTCAPAVQAALLRVIAEHVVGNRALHPDTWILAAANPTDRGASACDLEPPMANRLAHFRSQVSTRVVLDGFASGFDFPSPKFPIVPKDWRRELPAIGGMLAGFHAKLAGRLHAYPNNRADACGAWPSPRTWHYAAEGMAAARACGEPQDTEFEILDAFVGAAAASEYITWAKALDLPDPEEILGKAAAAQKAGKRLTWTVPTRFDVLAAIVGSVAARIRLDHSPDRWNAAMYAMQHIADTSVEHAVTGCRLLMHDGTRSARAHLSQEMIAKLYPRLARALRT